MGQDFRISEHREPGGQPLALTDGVGLNAELRAAIVPSDAVELAAAPHRLERDRPEAPRGRLDLEVEVYRSRRYGRPLALIAHPVTAPEAEATVERLVRVIDQVWVDRGHLFVLAPEAGRDGARSLIARLEELAPTLFDATAVRVATFPDDALTAGALLEAVAVSTSGVPDGHVRNGETPSLMRRLLSPGRRRLRLAPGVPEDGSA